MSWGMSIQDLSLQHLTFRHHSTTPYHHIPSYPNFIQFPVDRPAFSWACIDPKAASPNLLDRKFPDPRVYLSPWTPWNRYHGTGDIPVTSGHILRPPFAGYLDGFEGCEDAVTRGLLVAYGTDDFILLTCDILGHCLAQTLHSTYSTAV